MKKVLLVVGLSLGLASCTALQNINNIITGASVDPVAVYVAVNSFDAAEATATNYLNLKRCAAGGTIVCRSPAATKKIIPAVRSGRVARNNLEQFLQDNPGKLGPTGLYKALTVATDTLRQIYQQYNVGVTQ